MENTDLLRIVVDILRSVAKVVSLTAEMSNDELLKVSLGSLDSLTFIHMVVALEERLSTQFDDEMLMGGNFSTVSDLVNYIGLSLEKEGSA